MTPSKTTLGLPSTWSLNPQGDELPSTKRHASEPFSTWPVDPATRAPRAPRYGDASVEPVFGGARNAVASNGQVDPITGTSRTWTTTERDDRAPIRSAWSLNPSTSPKRDAFGGRREPQYTSSTSKPTRSGAFQRMDSTWSVDPSAAKQPPAYTAPPDYAEAPEHKKRGLKALLGRS